MRSTMIASLFALAVARVSAQYNDQSAPFYLVLKSHNATLNGSTLFSCHEGAAIEGLCLGGKLNDGSTLDSYTYNFNYSSNTQPDPVIGIQGYLTWELRGSNFNLSSPMQLSYDPTSNVAVPLFQPTESGLGVGFDADNKLFIPQYVDDSQHTLVYKTSRIYRWAICNTDAGYFYTTLAWIMGPHSAENPSCQKVDVVRVFA